MSPAIRRYLGIAVILAGTFLFVLNLQRETDGMRKWLPLVLLIAGVWFLITSRMKKARQ
jgi:membrane-bound ClpP family serine protease